MSSPVIHLSPQLAFSFARFPFLPAQTSWQVGEKEMGAFIPIRARFLNQLRIEIEENERFYAEKYPPEVFEGMKYFLDFFVQNPNLPQRVFTMLVFSVALFDCNYPLADLFQAAAGDFPRAYVYLSAVFKAIEKIPRVEIDARNFSDYVNEMQFPRRGIEE